MINFPPKKKAWEAFTDFVGYIDAFEVCYLFFFFPESVLLIAIQAVRFISFEMQFRGKPYWVYYHLKRSAAEFKDGLQTSYFLQI